MSKLEGQLTIMCNRDRPVEIEIVDKESGGRLAVVHVGHTQFVAALGRMGSCACTIEHGNLSKVGKIHESKRFEFPLTANKPITYKNREAVAKACVMDHCPEGWEPDNYYGSQDSFFEKDGEQWARTTIRRWVDRKETPDAD